MTYPLDITIVKLENKKGTSNKFYELTIVSVPGKQATLIKRYGKIGVLGEIIIRNFPSFTQAEKEFEKTFKQKTNGSGYDVAKNVTEKKVTDDAEFRSAIGFGVWPNLPKSFFTDLDMPGNLGGKELADPRFDPDTEKETRAWNDIPTQKLDAEELERARLQLAAEAEAIAQAEYASNPKFGMF